MLVSFFTSSPVSQQIWAINHFCEENGKRIEGKKKKSQKKEARNSCEIEQRNWSGRLARDPFIECTFVQGSSFVHFLAPENWILEQKNILLINCNMTSFLSLFCSVGKPGKKTGKKSTTALYKVEVPARNSRARRGAKNAGKKFELHGFLSAPVSFCPCR